jgi:GTP cyclohydrolase I
VIAQLNSSMNPGSSPPLGPKPLSALPSHLLNGSSPLQPSTGSSSSNRERESLNSSIRSSYRGSVDIQPISEAASSTVPTSLDNPADKPR